MTNIYSGTGGYGTLTFTDHQGTRQTTEVVVRGWEMQQRYPFTEYETTFDIVSRSPLTPASEPHPLAKIVHNTEDAVKLVNAGIVTAEEVREFWKLEKKKTRR